MTATCTGGGRQSACNWPDQKCTVSEAGGWLFMSDLPLKFHLYSPEKGFTDQGYFMS